MDALPRNAIVAVADFCNVPAVIRAILKCKGLDPSVFFVGWFCGFDDSVANSFAIGDLPCQSTYADAVTKIVRVQQLAHELGLQKRRVLLVLNGDDFQEGYADVFSHGKETHDIFPVLVQRHTNRVLNADLVGVDKSSFPLTPEDLTAAVAYDDQDVLVYEFREADKNETCEEKEDEVREVIMPASTRPKRTGRRPRQKKEPVDA